MREMMLRHRLERGAELNLGSSLDADFSLRDTNLGGRHVKIVCDERGMPAIEAVNRTYYMVGQGRHQSASHQLRKDDILKMGACSLQVTELCCAGPSAWGSAKEGQA